MSVWSSVRSEAFYLLAHADAHARRQLLGGALDSLTGSDVGDRLAGDIRDSARHNRVESRRGGKSRRHTTTTITCWRSDDSSTSRQAREAHGTVLASPRSEDVCV